MLKVLALELRENGRRKRPEPLAVFDSCIERVFHIRQSGMRNENRVLGHSMAVISSASIVAGDTSDMRRRDSTSRVSMPAVATRSASAFDARGKIAATTVPYICAISGR